MTDYIHLSPVWQRTNSHSVGSRHRRKYFLKKLIQQLKPVKWKHRAPFTSDTWRNALDRLRHLANQFTHFLQSSAQLTRSPHDINTCSITKRTCKYKLYLYWYIAARENQSFIIYGSNVGQVWPSLLWAPKGSATQSCLGVNSPNRIPHCSTNKTPFGHFYSLNNKATTMLLLHKLKICDNVKKNWSSCHLKIDVISYNVMEVLLLVHCHMWWPVNHFFPLGCCLLQLIFVIYVLHSWYFPGIHLASVKVGLCFFSVVLIHASFRMRNLKNKMQNKVEAVGFKKTPMGVLLKALSQETNFTL